ncbi:MAG: cell division protein FtsW [Firmicutes bacterium]|nr:cell division protein FtsW [Bacillota bacterium]
MRRRSKKKLNLNLNQNLNLNLGQSDFLVVALTTILVIFGLVMVFSASYYKSINDNGSPYDYLMNQGINAIGGFFLMFVFSAFDYHKYKKFCNLIIFGSIVLLVLVLTPLGVGAGGATRALYFGVTIMPGEIAKLAVIIFVSAYLSRDPRLILSFKKGVAPMLGLGLLMAGLIMKQPNLSTALTVCGIIGGIMILAGLRWIYVLVIGGVGGFGIFTIAMLGDKIGMDHWKARLVSFRDPFADAVGDGFQVVQSLLALGSGGLFGMGLGKSIQKNLYLPEPQNDFILAIIGEELGFVGLMLLIAVYGALIWRGFHIAMNAPDLFGMLLAGGVTIMIGLQVVMNIAVVTSSMPATGIALPFISYGGNALWICMSAIGILLNVSRQSISGVDAFRDGGKE